MEMQSTHLVAYMYRWRKPLLIFSVLAAGVGAIFSGPQFITPKYKASVVLFPATTNSISQALLVEKTSSSADVLEFGKEEEAEQLLQILHSDQIRRRVVQRFQLIKQNGIDPSDTYAQTRLMEEYNDNISFRRTQYMSVVIDVLDADPVMAADMANEIANLADTVKRSVQFESARHGYRIVLGKYTELQEEIRTYEDSLQWIRNKGVQDYETQIAVLNEQFAVALIEGKGNVAKQLQQQIDTLSRYGGAFIALRDQLEYYYEELAKMKIRLEQAKADAEFSLPHVFIVDRAFPAEKKTYPIRWLIVALAGVGAFLMTLVVLVARDSIQKAE